MQHQKKLTQLTVVLLTLLQYCCYPTLWNAEVVVWPFTTINSYGVEHTLAQKTTVTTKSLKICYLFNTNCNCIHFKIVRGRTVMALTARRCDGEW